ncbi:Thymidylate kinase [hydrothermal vent metagenome]|uniref:dTMP kinase n=1 Tax=hydrothermal vent metagenome TaxID=652676 RepID=A0A1W1EKG5_9ZZZZ
MYILFEGIDTTGKSTQVELLKDNFPEFIYTKEPGGTDFGVEAREILLEAKLTSKRAELLLFLADRAEHYREIIYQNRDNYIISDRGFLSGIGYALANGDFEFNQLLELNRFALEDNLPNKIILFTTNIDTLRERMGEKRVDGIEKRGLEYLIRVQEFMVESLERLDIDYLIIDSANSSVEDIYNRVVKWII